MSGERPDEEYGEEAVPPGVDAARPSIARVYDFLLGGKDNFVSDRQVGERIVASLPGVHSGVEQQRAVLRRAVRFLVGEVGIRQLVDIGTGLPTAGNVHEVAHRIAPATRVVYVDNDPVVLVHGRALLIDSPETIVVEGDLRDPDALLRDPDFRRLIDPTQPVGLLLCGVLHYLLDAEDPAAMVARLRDALPSGSYVFIHHLITAGDDPAAAEAQEALRAGLGRGEFRTVEQVAEFFTGFEFIDPGLVGVTEWRPEPTTPSARDIPDLRLAVAGVARN